jgi:O-Antigen ligase
MSLLLLVPGLISLFLVLRGRIHTAFLSVYLPCLLCLPDDYRLRLPHLPPTSTAEFALIPLGIVGIIRLIRSGSFALMDLLVILYTASIGLSEILHASLNDGVFSAINAFITIFLAYVVGRKLIEPDLRLATVRRFVTLVLLDGIPGLYEWRMGASLYGMFGQRVLGIAAVSAGAQLRNGHGRVGSVFGGDAELAGIAFGMTFCLNAWLRYLRRVKASVDLGKMLTKLEKYHVPGLLLLLYVLLTQSRGPLIALGAGFLILQIPRFESTRMMTIVVAVLLVGGYMAASAYFDSYTNVADAEVTTEQQGSAVYRKQMNEAYPPIAEKGGWTGYGVLGVPHVQGKMSIDNDYLLVHLAWGRLAYILFLLIVWENIRILLVRSWQLKAFDDRAFVFSVMAAMAVLWVTLLTVYLGAQMPQISFLLIGWVQSTGKAQVRGFSFRRVFT